MNVKHLQRRKARRWMLLLLMLPLMAARAYAYDFSAVCSTGQTLYYNITDAVNHTVELTCPNHVEVDEEGYFISLYPWQNFQMPTGSITLPETVENNGVVYTVTSVGDFAFFYCEGLTGSLRIPNSVTAIGNYAFEYCSGFNSLTIGSSVTTIGDYAFSRCSGFTGLLTIPNSVTTIGDYAFFVCESFTGSLTIGSSVTTIGDYAFSQCSGFTGSLAIGNSVTTIGNYAFEYCSGFNSLKIGSSVTTIGDHAFYGCTGFRRTLSIPETVTTIGNYAFYYCSGFTGSLTIPNSVTTIGEYAFRNCSGFTGSLTIGNSVTTIGEYAFYQCSGFTGSLTIGNSVTTIGSQAFEYCSGFTGSLTIGNSVTTIGYMAFYQCSGFTGSLTIPNSVTTIGNYAFEYCSGFTGSLTIGNSVTTIGYMAFYYCSGFTGSLTIGNSVTTIGDYAFEYCSGFNSIISKAATPPEAGSECFYVSNSTPVQVPCGSTEAYRQAAVWSDFTNYSEDLMFDIIVSSSNEAFGTVAVVQDIDCDNNQATVQATPNFGYQFVNWTTDCYYFEGFEDGIPSGWAIIDADGDGETWYVSSESGSHDIGPITSHNGSNHLMSESYCNASSCPLDPDNYLVMPRVSLPGGAVFSFWAAAQDSDFPEEHFGVAVSTGSQTNPNDFTLVEGAEWTITSGRGRSGNPRGGNRTGTEWVKYTVDLSAYAGQDCYIAIRHFNCPGQQALCIDDVELFSDEPMPVSDLATYSFVVTEDVNLTANFEPVDGYDIRVYANPVEGGTVTGAGIYGEMETVTLTATPNEDYRFVNWKDLGGNFSESFENGIPSDWAVIDADGDGYNWRRSSELLSAPSSHSGADMVSSQSYVNNVGPLTPDNYLVSPQVTLAAGSTFSFWACAQNAAWAEEHFGVAISTGSQTDAEDFETISEWTMTAKSSGIQSDGNRGGREVGAYYKYTVDLSAYAGQTCYIAIRHFGCTDMYFLNVDDVQLTTVLSTDPVYSFEATSNRQIVANFEYIGVVHVTPDGTGDGSSWDNALSDIQEAINLAVASNPKPRVWVKAGTYSGNNRSMDQLTVYEDGTSTVGTLPMYGYYADAYTRSQYVIPATEIAQMTGYPIYSLTYHTTSTPAQWTSSFQVYLKEVNYTTMNSLIAPTTATTVYTGKLTVANGKMTIVFDTPYYYNGGNLLIGMDCIEKGNYVSCNFQAAAVNGAGMYAYNYNAPTFGTPYAVNYAPTTTFNFGEGEDLFLMVEGVNVYGGFAGNEPVDYDLSSRDFGTNETVLDGQNTQRVLRQVDAFTTQTIWDGFTIANGNNGYNYGGGAYLMANSRLQNCVFEQCQGGNGGAVFANGTEFVNCVFRKNTAVNGGAVHVKNGGFVNCLFANNQADNGGAVFADGAAEFINCDMVSNKAANFGAGIYSNGGIFTNCIVWGNESDNETRQVSGEGSFSYCAVETGISGENNIVLSSQNTGNGFTYPRFENPSVTAGADDETENVSWRLMENSACINHGNNEAIAGYDLDIDGEDRIQLDVVDLGCYESPYEGIVIPDDGIVYVTPDGNGDGTSWENALNDIQEAMEMAAGADPKSMVWVAAGTYAGNGSIGGHLTAYANGSTTVNRLPMYALFADSYTRSQYVIPAAEIAQLTGYPINSLTYYTTSTPAQLTSSFQVYLTEVDYSTMSSLIDPTTATTVYTGQLTVANGKMTVVFDAPYYYNGGNLLIGMDCIEKGNFANCLFQAEAVDGAGMYAFSSSSPTFSTPTVVNSIPTTTFSFGEGEDLLLMVEGVNVYGGFAGNESADYDLSSRDFEMNETVLDGQNMRRVLHQTAAFTTQTIWDGFTIANGNNGYNYGGGAYIRANSTLQNCVFENCQGSYGGAVYNYSGTLINCIFRNNTASTSGGAVFAYGGSLSGCQFTNNQAEYGGAVYVNDGGRIVNCLFAYNQAYYGGAICTYAGRYANCLFENNQANYGGGVYVDSRYGSSEFINCNIVNNNSPYYGGGIYIYGDGSTFTNCIVWGNNSNQVYGNGNFNYCAVEGGISGENNICLTSQNDSNGYLSPKFENPSLTAGADDETENVSWRLMEGSACINKGNNETVAGYEMDLAGESRIQQDVVDLGCYESPYEGTVIPEFTDGIVYVTPEGSGDGTSWSNATNDIRKALQMASLTDSKPMVWVAAGTYQGNDDDGLGDTFEFSFDSDLDGWTNIDADADGEVWYHSTQADAHSVLAITSHSGEGHAMSESYCNATWLALNPDNFLVSPQMYNIGSSSTLSFWACAQEANYAAEHFGVAISTTGNTNASDFTTIQEWTLSAKGGDGVPEGDTRSSKNDRGGTWHNYTCDLSAFAGQQVWIAIRHFNCTDKFILCLDDISLKNGGGDLYTMMEGVNVYGGFVGNEPADYDLSSRDIETNLTVLDGQHERTVLRQANDFATLTIWDGFTIANGSNNSFDIVGSGAYLMANSKLQNCVFEHCQSDNWGGAVLAYGAEFVNCVFRNNAALYGGGALYVVDGRIVNCLFANNQASYGGGVCVDGEAEFINCDIVNNKSDDYGSGVYSYSDNGTFTNCIIWGNQSDEGLPQVNDKGNYSHCAVEGGMEGEDNIKLSPRNTGDFFCPQFENPSSTAGIDNAADNASWRLSETSICVNRGDNEAIAGYAMDLDGENRVYNDAVVDLGCYESAYEISNLVYPDGIAYVTPEGDGDGTSWDNAMNDIQDVMDALTFAESDPVIWVAAGTYLGNDGSELQMEMTAYPNGTATVGTLPMYGGYADYYTRSQYVIPAAEIAQLAGYPIYSLTYYTTSNPSQWTSDFQVYLTEVSNSTMSSLIDPTTATTVYTGKLSVANGEMTVIFDTPYHYNGGNLLIGMDCLSSNGNYSVCSFKAVSKSNAGMYAYNNTEATFSYSFAVNYVPTTTFNGEIVLYTMKEGLDVYGGFEGNEPADYDLSLRDFEANQTVLDGQLEHRVLYQPSDFTTQTIWDGFTLANGRAEDGNGGGALLKANSKLQNCVFENCQAYNGGAVYADGSEFENCIFRNDTATNDGGAVYLDYGDGGRFVNCLFAYNQAKRGGAICYYNQSYTESSPEFINCDIVNNSVTSDGYGGGIYNQTYGSNAIYTNCIVWGNKRNSYSNQIDGSGVAFSYCAVQGGWSGTGNINLAAANDGTSTSYKYVRFVNPENGDFRLKETSACVNMGKPDFTPSCLVDLEGNPRIYGDRIDIGCYEFSLSDGFHFLGMTNANWNLAANWLNSSMPSADDEAFIDANCVVNEDVDILKLTVSNGKSLSVPAGSTLTAGTLVTTAPAQLIIEDGGQLLNENNDVKGTVKKNINGYGTSEDGWYMIASPVTDNTNVTNLTFNTYNLFTFDGSEVLEWRTQHDNPVVNHKTGYLYANQDGTMLEFKGTLAGTADATVLTLAEEGDGKEFPGFNLIGNPYPCNAYITNSYYRMNGMGNGFIPGIGAIAPCEGIFVDADTDGQMVTFSKTPMSNSFLSLTVAKDRGMVDDRVVVRFDENRGLQKFMFNEIGTKLYIPQDDKEYAVVSAAESNRQDDVTVIPVNFKTSKSGTYTLSFDMENVSAEYIHFIDNLTGEDVDLLAALTASKGTANNIVSYTFVAKPSDYASRFKLVFRVDSDATIGSENFAYISNGNLVIDHIDGQATLQIIDVLGRVLNTEIVSGSYNKALNLSAGLYVICLDGKTQKIVVD